jgi:transcriptional regulator with XRE-family HTH domain
MTSKIERANGPHPVDVHVGARLRLRRVYLGFSQARLAGVLGLTFQQIQKYERGVNRISASKLFELAVLLDVPVGFFFDGAEGAVGDLLENRAKKGRAGKSVWPTNPDQGFMTKKETTQLIGNYYRINDESLRQGVLALVKSLGKTTLS